MTQRGQSDDRLHTAPAIVARRDERASTNRSGPHGLVSGGLARIGRESTTASGERAYPRDTAHDPGVELALGSHALGARCASIPHGRPRILNRLRVEGLLESEWVDSGTGHPRKYYKLTDAGRRRVKEMSRAWNVFSDKLNSILQSSGLRGNA